MRDKDKLISGYDMLYLAKCALSGDKADLSRIKSNLVVVYYMAEFHSIAALCGSALEEVVGVDEGAKNLFEEARNQALIKNAMFDAERQAVLNFLEESGIRYLLLKGSILKAYYPKPYMREMADVDIWYDRTHQNELAKWFENRGYLVECLGKSEHDVFKKLPIYNFEMHTELYSKAYNEVWENYYIEKLQSLSAMQDTRCGMQFSDEDFYVYMMSHAYKHYKANGTGLRTLVDFYVLTKQLEPKADRKYIDRELEHLGLVEFERELISLCQKMFSQECLTTEEEQLMLERILLSGTYGTGENAIKNLIVKASQKNEITLRAKLKYIRSRIFLDSEEMKEHYHAKYAWMLPFCHLYRILFVGMSRIGSVIKELRIVIRAK